MNTYAYVGGNPTGKIDTLGLAEICYRALEGRGGTLLWAADKLGAALTGGATRRLDASLKTVAAHQHIVYEDGSNSGYGGGGVFSESGKSTSSAPARMTMN